MIKEGMKVRFTDEHAHHLLPEFYPPKGTVGTVTTVHGEKCCFVKWPDGSTSEGGDWAVCTELLEVVE